VLTVVLTGCGSNPRPVAYSDVTAATGKLEFTRITRGLFRDRAELLEVLERHNPGLRIELPPIDFSRRAAYLVATGPRSSTGYGLQIVRVEDDGDQVLVVVRERTPSLGDPATPRVTYPFRLIVLPRTEKPVKLKWLGRP
jgi:protease stability complex PrcB-like protein